MKVIRDIRIYRNNIENIDGNSLPSSFDNKELCITIYRIALKLEEQGFSMGDFHHLYINLTTCDVEDMIAPAKRSKDRYYPWYRYYDVHITRELYDSLESKKCIKEVVSLLEQVLEKFFSTEFFDKELIHSCVATAVDEGEEMLVKYREKKSSKNRAIIYLRYLDNGNFYPLLRVFDLEENLIFEKDMPEAIELLAYGDIQLSAKKIVIKPRKNFYTKDDEPMSFLF